MRAVVQGNGQPGWTNLYPEQQRVFALYPVGKRTPQHMLTLWRATNRTWQERIVRRWMAAARKIDNVDELRRLKRELQGWRGRMADYETQIRANLGGGEKSIAEDVTRGLLLKSPHVTAVPDFLFPLYFANQFEVLKAADAENRQYFRQVLAAEIEKHLRALEALGSGITRTIGFWGNFALPLTIAVAGGYTVYWITRGKR